MATISLDELLDAVQENPEKALATIPRKLQVSQARFAASLDHWAATTSGARSLGWTWRRYWILKATQDYIEVVYQDSAEFVLAVAWSQLSEAAELELKLRSAMTQKEAREKLEQANKILLISSVPKQLSESIGEMTTHVQRIAGLAVVAAYLADKELSAITTGASP